MLRLQAVVNCGEKLKNQPKSAIPQVERKAIAILPNDFKGFAFKFVKESTSLQHSQKVDITIEDTGAARSQTHTTACKRGIASSVKACHCIITTRYINVCCLT